MLALKDQLDVVMSVKMGFSTPSFAYKGTCVVFTGKSQVGVGA